MKAFHCVALVESVENTDVSAVGITSGTGVRRRSNVARIAALSVAPSNANVCARNHTSKKSFIRLLAMPRCTMASSFSATTDWRGYARSLGAGAPRSVGNSTSTIAGVTASPNPTSTWSSSRALPM
jgi:hypothetical protein